jgi:hypothetical protein
MEEEAQATAHSESLDTIEVYYKSRMKKKQPKAKAPLKYKAVSISIKQSGGLLMLSATHLCGQKMLCCLSCNKIFCPVCDAFPPKTASQCCRNAFDAHLRAYDEKDDKRRALKKELSKRVRHGNTKYKVSITEIDNGNKL